MSEIKPNVFPSADQINAANETGQKITEQLLQENQVQPYQVPSGEAEAAAEMAKRTAEQLRLRNEAIARNKQIAEEAEIKRNEMMNQTRESVNAVRNNPPIVPPTIPPVINNEPNYGNNNNSNYNPYIESISQPQMNQAFDVIPLPSGGKFYPGRKKSIKVAYLTTADENILTSPNLVESGQFIEILINRKLLEPGLRYKDLLPGDRNAIMIWLRATGYGEMYPVLMTDKNGEEFETEINLSDLKTINLTIDPEADGLYSFELPLSKHIVRFKLLTCGDIDELERIIENIPDGVVNEEQTMILEKQIVEVDGNRDRGFIKSFVNGMRILDAQKLREYVSKIKCDIDLSISVRTPGGESIDTFLPFTPRFFWPNSGL
jgi:hypothetical protein